MTEKTASFGFRDVPEEEKEGLVKEVFSSVAARYDLCRAGKALHQFGQRPLHFENDVRGALDDLRTIAAELDGVAKTLFGMQQNGLAGDIVRAGP